MTVGNLAWPASGLGTGLTALTRQAQLSEAPAVELPSPPNSSAAALAWWVAQAASQLGVEAEPIHFAYGDADRVIRQVAPALVRVPTTDPSVPPQFLLLLKSSPRRVTLLGFDLALHRFHPDTVRQLLCQAFEAPHTDTVDRWLAGAGTAPRRRERARQALLTEQLGPLPLTSGWLLRPSPGASLWQAVRHLHLPRTLLILVGIQVMQQLLLLAAWWVIGRAALAGHFDRGWLVAWALLLLTTVPFLTWSLTLFSWVAVDAGALFKSRLIFGALQLIPEEIRHAGAGQFLGRVMESEAVEQLALSGGFTALLALIQLGLAVVVLGIGAGGWSHALLLMLWTLAALGLALLYWRRSQCSTDAYRDLSNDLIERMVGHRTRLAQEDPAAWHREEDHALLRYWALLTARDRLEGLFNALVPRGWMIVGLGGLAYTLAQQSTTPALLALSLGGLLLGLQALMGLTTGIQSLVEAAVAWGQVKPLFRAAARPQDVPHVETGLTPTAAATDERQTFLTAKGLHFRYGPRSRPILHGCNLQIRQGDRLLLEGPSGGGKSTLAALLAGLRTPESGLLLLWGFDRTTLGRLAWRHKVVSVPQFHENHVFTGTLGFNLLMGRGWPPQPGDLSEAEALCHELGLGALLERMPSGMQTMVGESGWRLSHGERSRLYIARALLQQPDLMILDESFAALDPENMRIALEYVLRRAPTLLVIAHP